MKPGGVLVYSTCSIDPEENEDRINVFLNRNPVGAHLFSRDHHVSRIESLDDGADVGEIQEFSVDSAAKFVPSDFVTNGGFYSSNPVKHSLDGAFAARLVRSS